MSDDTRPQPPRPPQPGEIPPKVPVTPALLFKQEQMEIGRESNVDLAGFDLGGLIGWLLANKDQIGSVISLIKEKLKKSPKPKPADPAKPIPSLPDKDEEIPATPHAPAATNYANVPSGLFAKLKGLKREGQHLTGAQFKRFKDYEDPAIPGDVINFDIDPLDADGSEIESNTPPLAGLLKDPAYGTYLNVGDEFTSTGKRWSDKSDGYNNHLLGYTLENGQGLDLVGEYRNYGCGINVKVPLDWVGDRKVYLTAHMVRRDGKSVVSNRVGPFHVKSS